VKNERILCDYRETVSDLLLENFTDQWRKWSHSKRAIIRNQAHGSPANILDLYAASDIPETEGTELLRIKFATSAAHVTGKKLVSAEAATWLNEHFRSTLWDVKQSLDRYFLGGVNHVCYHGTAYSPANEPWPGWLFYAAVHFNPRNSWWNDFTTLNEYATRVQSFLQSGKPGNDVLLHFPISDFYSERGNALIRHFDGTSRMTNSGFQAAAETLQTRGFAFDFISDRQLQKVSTSGSELRTGGATYRTIVVPECRYVPLETLEKLVSLAKSCARIVFIGKLPDDVAGFSDLESRQKRFQKVIATLHFTETNERQIRTAKVGKGEVLMGGNVEQALAHAGVSRETMADSGLQFFRGNRAEGVYYFIANRGQSQFADWTTLETKASHAGLFDVMRGGKGLLPVRKSDDGKLQVYLQLAPGESCIVQTIASAAAHSADSSDRASLSPYSSKNDSQSYMVFHEPAGPAHEIAGSWSLKFLSGGPELPEPMTLTQLGSWTESSGDAGKRFSGTAEYSITFRPSDVNGDAWLDLGQVCESAQVHLNGKDLGTLIGPPFRVLVPKDLLKRENQLQIRVANLMANRIADLDRRKVPWKKFYNVNFPARLGENRKNGLFDASHWEPLPSGLLGPVTLTPVKTRGLQ
jgi:hypothetical protein